LRGAFYCVEQPIWEGYDEWAHFAYIQYIAEHHRLPERTDRVSGEVRRSLDLVPLSSSAAEAVHGALTHDAFWRLPLPERLRREREFRKLNPECKNPDAGEQSLLQYEAQQPPLYYLLLTLPYLAVKGFPLPARVLILRVISLSISAAALPLAYGIARRVAAARRIAILIPVLLASFSGLLIDVCCVGNDSLAIVAGSAAVLGAVRLAGRRYRRADWMIFGTILTAALLTKAYFLAFVPLVPLLAAMQGLRKRATAGQAITGCGLALGIVALGAGWWYAHAWAVTGTLSGEMLDAATAGLRGKLGAVWQVRWWRVLDTAAFTHIWTGGWSFLGVRSWMYRVFETFAVAAAAGVIALTARMILNAARRRIFPDDAARFAAVAGAYLLIVLGIGYFTLGAFLATGLSVGIGWYLYAAVSAEMVLLAAGFTGLAGVRRAGGCAALLCLLALAFDLYTMHFVLAPYYTGLIGHRPNGSLGAFRIGALADAGMRGICARLSVNKGPSIGPAVVAAVWAGYVSATGALMMFSAAQLYRAAFSRNLSSRGGPSKS
jgi:hypothetical protein